MCLLPGPTYFPGPNCLVLETGYVFLLHLSYTHRHFPNKLLCLHLLTGCFPNKNPCPHLPIEADWGRWRDVTGSHGHSLSSTVLVPRALNVATRTRWWLRSASRCSKNEIPAKIPTWHSAKLSRVNCPNQGNSNSLKQSNFRMVPLYLNKLYDNVLHSKQIIQQIEHVQHNIKSISISISTSQRVNRCSF